MTLQSDGFFQVDLPGSECIVVAPGAGSHPTWRSDAILYRGKEVASVQTIKWQDPGCIPAVDKPRSLPVGAGSGLLNVLAKKANKKLRYRGPYPTRHLFRSLLASFDVTSGTEDCFVAELSHGLATGKNVEPAVEFLPRPFERVFLGDSATVDLRNGLERVFLHGKKFSWAQEGCRRLEADGDAVVASFWLGQKKISEAARFGRDGDLRVISEPQRDRYSFTGTKLPSLMRAIIGHHALSASSLYLHDEIKRLVKETEFVWGVCDWADAEKGREGQVLVNSELVVELPEDQVPLVVAQAVTPILVAQAKNELSRQVDQVARTHGYSIPG